MPQKSDAPWARIGGPGDLGTFLREIRLQADLTQEDLAESIGADRRFVHQVETGQSPLYTMRLFALLRELGVELQVHVR
ncbi:helix-turn-helix domain-containing protein [Kineosporia babensis]|uniref:helix-turn-helix domain-containing protein n=1 Tax=Kineosporia babensis TaxID=499548 RepID=UPI0038B2907F